MPASNVISQAALYWQDPIHGSVELSQVEEISKTDNQGAETVFNVRGQGYGVRYTPGATTFSFTERVTTAPSVDWELLRKRQVQGLLIIDEIGGASEPGRRRTYECAVVKVDESVNNQGEATQSVELTATRSDKVR